jgi:hypothetical protein
VVEAIYRSAQSGQKQTVASFLVDAAHD